MSLITTLLPKIKFAHNISIFIHMFRRWKSFIFGNKIQLPKAKKEVLRNVKILPNTFVGIIFQALGFLENLIPLIYCSIKPWNKHILSPNQLNCSSPKWKSNSLSLPYFTFLSFSARGRSNSLSFSSHSCEEGNNELHMHATQYINYSYWKMR